MNATFERRVSEYLDGELDMAGRAQLAAEISADDALRHEFCRLAAIHGQLHALLGAQRDGQDLIRRLQLSLLDDGGSDRINAAIRARIERPSVRIRQQQLARRTRPLSRPLVAVFAALILLGGGGMAWVLDQLLITPPSGTIERVAVARIVALTGSAERGGSQVVRVGAVLEPGDVLVLDGSAELTLLDEPIELSLAAGRYAFTQDAARGTIVCTVLNGMASVVARPLADRDRFVVQTEELRCHIIGTKYEVGANERGSTVAVSSGVVEVIDRLVGTRQQLHAGERAVIRGIDFAALSFDGYRRVGAPAIAEHAVGALPTESWDATGDWRMVEEDGQMLLACEQRLDYSRCTSKLAVDADAAVESLHVRCRLKRGEEAGTDIGVGITCETERDGAGFSVSLFGDSVQLGTKQGANAWGARAIEHLERPGMFPAGAWCDFEFVAVSRGPATALGMRIGGGTWENLGVVPLPLAEIRAVTLQPPEAPLRVAELTVSVP